MLSAQKSPGYYGMRKIMDRCNRDGLMMKDDG